MFLIYSRFDCTTLSGRSTTQTANGAGDNGAGAPPSGANTAIKCLKMQLHMKTARYQRDESILVWRLCRVADS